MAVFLKLIGAFFMAFKNPKAAGAATLMGTALAGGGYALMDQVNSKHQEAIVRIDRNQEQVQQLLRTTDKILVKLDSIKEGIDDTKVQVERNLTYIL